MKRHRSTLAAFFLGVLPLPGLAEVTVIDSAGRKLGLNAPAERIIALAPHIVENVFSAGAGKKLVGVVSYSNYPEAASELPEVGSAYAWSLETVVALKPDLVILWGSGNGIKSLARLEALGIKVYVSEPRVLEDISDSIRDFGVLADTGEEAALAADQFDGQVKKLRSRFEASSPLSVFYEIWNSPLQTVNDEHMISQVIRLCGGRNVFGELPQLAPQISTEAVLDRDPDAIVASGMGESRPEWLDDWIPYRSLKAVQRGALFHIHPDLIQRPTTRIAEGAAVLCEQLDSARGETN